MNIYIILSVIWIFCIIAFIIFTILLEKDNNYEEDEENLPYSKKDFLLNIYEKKFFIELEKIIPENYFIYPQVLLSNIVKVNNVSKKDFWYYQNKINRKIVDFVIFEKKSLTPFLVVEYDWTTHNKADRIERDLFVNEVLESAWIKIIHIKHSKNLDIENIKNDLYIALWIETLTEQSSENNNKI